MLLAISELGKLRISRGLSKVLWGWDGVSPELLEDHVTLDPCGEMGKELRLYGNLSLLQSGQLNGGNKRH